MSRRSCATGAAQLATIVELQLKADSVFRVRIGQSECGENLVFDLLGTTPARQPGLASRFVDSAPVLDDTAATHSWDGANAAGLESSHSAPSRLPGANVHDRPRTWSRRNGIGVPRPGLQARPLGCDQGPASRTRGLHGPSTTATWNRSVRIPSIWRSCRRCRFGWRPADRRRFFKLR